MPKTESAFSNIFKIQLVFPNKEVTHKNIVKAAAKATRKVVAGSFLSLAMNSDKINIEITMRKNSIFDVMK